MLSKQDVSRIRRTAMRSIEKSFFADEMSKIAIFCYWLANICVKGDRL